MSGHDPHEETPSTGRSERPADSVAGQLRPPRFLDELDGQARARARRADRQHDPATGTGGTCGGSGWEHALDASTLEFARERRSAARREHARGPDRRLRGAAADGRGHGGGDLARPPDGLVPLARARAEPRGGAARRQDAARRARREDRRARPALEGSADPGLPALARRRARDGADADAPHEDPDRPRLVHRARRTATTRRRS